MADIRTIILAGAPAEMGLYHGRRLREEIRFLLHQIDAHIFRRLGPAHGLGVRVVSRGLALIMGRHLPSHLREELQGIARGSGLPFVDLLLLNTLDDVLNILRRLAPRAPGLACSSFALFGPRCQDGALIHGRNLDYHFRNTPLDDHGAVSRLLQRQAALFVFRPLGRAAFVSIGWPGLVACQTAMNEAGVSLGNLTSYVRGTSPNGTPSGILYRRVMEETGSLQEVRQLLRSNSRTIGNNLMVGSGRENAAALFEIARDSVAEVPPRSGLLVGTNHFASETLARRQRPFLLPHSVARRARLLAICDREGITLAEALGFLGDVGCAPNEREDKPFNRIANEGTAVSVLFRPGSLELWIGINAEPPASHGEFRRIDAAALFRQPPES